MLQRIPGGLLVAVEGIDGAGKTTQATLLAQFFGERGFATAMSKEPTSCKWGQELRAAATSGRSTPEEELELFLKDRADHVARTIQPALDEGMLLILDRYYPSNAAYQGARTGDPVGIIEANELFAPKPDVLLIFNLEATNGLLRIRARGDEPNTFENEDYLRQVGKIFLDLEMDNKHIIDATQSVRDIRNDVLNIVREAAIAKLGEGEAADALR